MSTHKPSTPLPWNETIRVMVSAVDSALLKSDCRKAESAIAGFVQGNADYIAHAASAYPLLVEALRAWLPPTEAEDGTQDAEMRSLLRSLGEDAS